MANRGSSRSTTPSIHRFFVPTLLLLVFVTAVALLFNGSGPTIQTVDITRTHLGSIQLHAYVKKTILTWKFDPIRVKVNLLFKQAQDHMDLVNVYAFYARKGKVDMMKQAEAFTEQAGEFTKLLNKPKYKALHETKTGVVDEELLKRFEKELKKQLKASRLLVAEAKDFFDNQGKIQKLQDTIFAVKDQLSRARKQGEFASLVAFKSTPKSLHCISMRLLEEWISDPDRYSRGRKPVIGLDDPNLYHYVVISDNVLATSVVISSVVKNAKDPSKHVFHIATDEWNFRTMRVWFKMRPPNKAVRIEVKSVRDFRFLPYESQIDENGSNPKHLPLTYLRFYLPAMYPKLQKILLLDDDVVVQKDLTKLWGVRMGGKVNLAVEICSGPSLHRYSQYMNFSHPAVMGTFDPKACAWAYGMNLFDLDAWRRKNCTAQYHKWQHLNKERTLWKLGTLPAGLMTFYKATKALDKSWHVLGLGSNPNINSDKIKNAAVIHYNGNMKPWLDIALNQYKDLWTKYVDYGMEFVQMCNFGH